VSERRACRVLGQRRSTQRKPPARPGDEAALTAATVALATRYGRYGRYGHRRITAPLRDAGRAVSAKRVERLWRREGLKVPRRQPEGGRLWPNDGSCVRLRPERPDHVWSHDLVEDRTHDGRGYRMPDVVDEYARECLAVRVDRKPGSTEVIDVLSDLPILRGVPGHIRSDDGPEFVAKAVRERTTAVGADGPHRARQPVGERLRRGLQRQAPRRATRRRGFLLPGRGRGRDRGLATTPRHQTPALGPGLQAASTRGGPTALPPAGRATAPKPVMH